MASQRHSKFFLLVVLFFVLASCQPESDQSAQVEEQVQAIVAATKTKEAFNNSLNEARQTAAAEKIPTHTATSISTAVLCIK